MLTAAEALEASIRRLPAHPAPPPGPDDGPDAFDRGRSEADEFMTRMDVLVRKAVADGDRHVSVEVQKTSRRQLTDRRRGFEERLRERLTGLGYRNSLSRETHHPEGWEGDLFGSTSYEFILHVSW